MGLEKDSNDGSPHVPVSGGTEEEFPGVPAAVQAQLHQLLAERRYEEALDLLHSARWQAPDAVEISRTINRLKERLVRHYLHRIGNLDSVPHAAADADNPSLPLSNEERTLLR